MSDQANIPTLTDIIERGIEIKMSDLGLDDDLQINADDVDIEDTAIDITEPDLGIDEPLANALADSPALEQTIRRILDEHMELALQEIKLAIKAELDKP